MNIDKDSYNIQNYKLATDQLYCIEVELYILKDNQNICYEYDYYKLFSICYYKKPNNEINETSIKVDSINDNLYVGVINYDITDTINRHIFSLNKEALNNKEIEVIEPKSNYKLGYSLLMIPLLLGIGISYLFYRRYKSNNDYN
jgi:hypothetical protein